MDTQWARIQEFPDYSISNYGEVVNEHTQRLMRLSTTLQGAIKVNLVNEEGRSTRSVKVLVAEAFVNGQNDIFNTPIHLDGEQRNCRADNLMWRPRWFAWKYTRQFRILPGYINRGPVLELESQVQYFTIYDAATSNGLLFLDVWQSILLVKDQVFPTWQRFWIS